MSMTKVVRAGLLVALLVLSPLVPSGPTHPVVRPASADQSAVASEQFSQLDGVTIAADGALELTGQTAAWSEAPFQFAGTAVGAPVTLAQPARVLLATWDGDALSETAVRLEVRGWADGGPTPWEEAAPGGPVGLAMPVATAQYRLTLLSQSAAVSPRVRSVRLDPAPDDVERVQSSLVASQRPATTTSLRLYATRIGLIGGTTANGTVIAPEDRFVALPSRRVLATKGSRDYEVRIEYKGRSVTIPVWDIGPWNVRDNYWDAPTRRDMWNDLPAGQPQAAAAYFDAYHGGRDGFGRRILSPASIDISDAAFYELGMTNGDWVQVTLLWQPRR
jgi:hypothetical protein